MNISTTTSDTTDQSGGLERIVFGPFNRSQGKDPPPGSIEVFQQTRPGNCVLKERETVRNAVNRLLEENYQLRLDLNNSMKPQEKEETPVPGVEDESQQSTPLLFLPPTSGNSGNPSYSATPVALIHYDVSASSPVTLLQRLVNHLESVTDPKKLKTNFKRDKLSSTNSFDVEVFFKAFFEMSTENNKKSNELNETSKRKLSSSDITSSTPEAEREQPISDEENSATPPDDDVTRVESDAQTSPSQQPIPQTQENDNLIDLTKPSPQQEEEIKSSATNELTDDVDKALTDLVASLAEDLLKDEDTTFPDDQEKTKPSPKTSRQSWQSDGSCWNFENDVWKSESEATDPAKETKGEQDAGVTQRATFSFDDVRYVTRVIKAMLQTHKKEMETKELAVESDAKRLIQLEEEKTKMVNLKEQNMDIFHILRQFEAQEISLLLKIKELIRQLSDSETAEWCAKASMVGLKQQNLALFDMLRQLETQETKWRLQIQDVELQLSSAVEVNDCLRQALHRVMSVSSSSCDSSSSSSTMSEYTPTNSDSEDLEEEVENLNNMEIIQHGIDDGLVRLQIDFRFSLVLRLMAYSSKIFQAIRTFGTETVPQPVIHPNWDHHSRLAYGLIAGSVLLAELFNFDHKLGTMALVSLPVLKHWFLPLTDIREILNFKNF